MGIIERKKIIGTKEDFYYLDPLKNIPEEYWNQKVWIHVTSKRSPLRIDTNKRLRDFLNERFIIYQLRQLRLRPIPIIESIEMTKREVWYYIEILAKKSNTEMDGNYRGFVSAITEYCRKIQERVDVPYWAYVLDKLKIKAKARATVYERDEEDKDIYKPIGLDKDTLKKYADAPFFLILCEKEGVITSFLKEIIERGYNEDHFYCLNLGGEAPTNAIRLIRKYLNIKNFHIFVLHDMDMKGLEIFFDIKQHFNCKSIGVNPKFLEYCEYDFDESSEEYRTDAGKKLPRVSEKLEAGTYTILSRLDISIEEKEMYNNWIEMIIEKRIELNSITAHKIESDPSVSKVTDFVNYFIHILEDTPWNLNRVRDLEKEGNWDDYWTIKTELDRVNTHPEFIKEFAEDNTNLLVNKINEEHKEYLESIKEIDDTIATNTENIKDKLDDLQKDEKESIDNMIEELNKKYPKIFDIDWENILPNTYPERIEILNKLIKMSEKGVRFNSIKKYIQLSRQLKNYTGSIKKEAPERTIKGKEKELRTHIYNDSGRPEAIKRIEGYDKSLEYCLLHTTEYREAEVDVKKLKKELEEREKKKDNKRLKFLGNFKKRMEKVFTKLIGDLNKFDNENDD